MGHVAEAWSTLRALPLLRLSEPAWPSRERCHFRVEGPAPPFTFTTCLLPSAKSGLRKLSGGDTNFRDKPRSGVSTPPWFLKRW